MKNSFRTFIQKKKNKTNQPKSNPHKKNPSCSVSESLLLEELYIDKELL